MNAPLYNRVLACAKRQKASFHTPGTSGNPSIAPFFMFAKYDTTELKDTDNLESPRAVIAEAEMLLAKAYGAKKSLIITSGATTAIFIAIDCVKNNGLILMGRNTHKSVVNACKTLSAKYDVINVCDIASIDKYTKAHKNKKIAAVVVTSPDYFGNVVDTKALYDYLSAIDIKLIVDEAHGSHFAFSSLFPETAAHYADFVIDSMHKTLPVMTGGAVLNVNAQDMLLTALLSRKKIHTTSPNYLTMASIDFARAYMTENGENLYKELKKRILEFVALIKDSNFCVKASDDFTRLVIDCGKFCADELNFILYDKGIEAEFAYANKLVFIVTPFNMDKLPRLAKVLLSTKLTVLNETTEPIYAKKRLKRRGNIELVDIKNALGKVSACEIGLYPPGTITVATGDVLTEELIDYLLKNVDELYGTVEDGKIAVFQ